VKKWEKEETLDCQELEDQRRRFFLSMGRSSRGEESQEDFGNLRWGLGGEFGGTQVCGVWRKRRRRVKVAMVIETKESLFRKI